MNNYSEMKDDVIKFCLLGKAVPKPSVRVAGKRAYFTRESYIYRAKVRGLFYDKVFQDSYFKKDIPLSLRLNIYREIPKSWRNKNKKAAMQGHILPVSRPDNDNYTKMVKDALTGIAWYDDAQVCKETICKWYSDTPRIEGIITRLDVRKET